MHLCSFIQQKMKQCQWSHRFFVCNVLIILAFNNTFHGQEAAAAKAGNPITKNATKTFKALSSELIQHVNSQPNRTWTAGENLRLKGFSMKYIKNSLLGQIEPRNHSALKIFQKRGPSIKNPLEDTPLPVAFDARVQWPQCKSISNIRDQGNCGSCWAVSSASAITDRVCIGLGGTKNPYISAEDVNSCSGSGGCGGGMTSGAFDYWNNTGIVSGGNYGTQIGCKPYSIPPCAHYVVSNLKGCKEAPTFATPTCAKSCETGFTASYTADRYMAREIYWLGDDIPSIQRDLMNNGPAAASFKVYADFLSYKSGVYQHITGAYVGSHAVKIFGWGNENNVNFWWAANSWNTAWGDSGVFKIIRGTNEGNIDQWMLGGLPVVAAVPDSVVKPHNKPPKKANTPRKKIKHIFLI